MSEKTIISVQIPVEWKEALEAIASEEHLTVSDILRRIIRHRISEVAAEAP